MKATYRKGFSILKEVRDSRQAPPLLVPQTHRHLIFGHGNGCLKVSLYGAMDMCVCHHECVGGAVQVLVMNLTECLLCTKFYRLKLNC